MSGHKLYSLVFFRIAKTNENRATAALSRFFSCAVTGAGRPRRRPRTLDPAYVGAASRATLLAIAALGPSACAGMDGIAHVGRTTYSVEKLGHGAYSVRTHIIGPIGDTNDAKAANVQAATTYCSKKGLAMTAIGDKSSGGLASEDTLTFRCGVPAKTT